MGRCYMIIKGKRSGEGCFLLWDYILIGEFILDFSFSCSILFFIKWVLGLNKVIYDFYGFSCLNIFYRWKYWFWNFVVII